MRMLIWVINLHLQRGAKLFVNYCLSCHSASYARFNGVAKDIGIPEDVLKKNMLFVTDKVGSYMNSRYG